MHLEQSISPALVGLGQVRSRANVDYRAFTNHTYMAVQADCKVGPVAHMFKAQALTSIHYMLTTVPMHRAHAKACLYFLHTCLVPRHSPTCFNALSPLTRIFLTHSSSMQTLPNMSLNEWDTHQDICAHMIRSE